MENTRLTFDAERLALVNVLLHARRHRLQGKEVETRRQLRVLGLSVRFVAPEPVEGPADD